MPRKEPNYQTMTCPICNKERTVNMSIKRDRERKTCGARECYTKLGAQMSNKTTVKCKICETEFSLSSHNVQKDGNYCSDLCRKRDIK